jgi:hypothetical protein
MSQGSVETSKESQDRRRIGFNLFFLSNFHQDLNQGNYYYYYYGVQKHEKSDAACGGEKSDLNTELTGQKT